MATIAMALAAKHNDVDDDDDDDNDYVTKLVGFLRKDYLLFLLRKFFCRASVSVVLSSQD